MGPLMQRAIALSLGILAGAIVVVLSWAGSRRFEDFDSALVGYAVGTVFATTALVYRYALWVTRPPTRRYFVGGWSSFLSWRNFARYAALVPVALGRDIFGQTFLLRRGALRWVMHLCIFWGVVLSLLVTIPLTLGWIRFTLVPPDAYRMWVFGVPLSVFPVEQPLATLAFHALDWAALLLVAGLAIALWRRLGDVGLLTTQRFGFDLYPIVLLLAIALTGLALTASSHWWQGRFYWFLSLTHEIVVVTWLLSLPFAKFFHVVERPASIGVTLYQTVQRDAERRAPPAGAACRRCGRALPSARFVADLRATLAELGQHYDLGVHGALQEYCPTCKRVLRGEAYYRVLGKRFL